MKPLMDLGIYIVARAKARDPLELGSTVGRKLQLDSIDVETLLTAIYQAKHFGIEDSWIKEAEEVISQTPWHEELDKIL